VEVAPKRSEKKAANVAEDSDGSADSDEKSEGTEKAEKSEDAASS